MKIIGAAAVAVMMGSRLWAVSVPAAGIPIVVCLSGNEELGVEHGAKIMSSAIFERIGVRIQWQNPRNCPPNGILITLLHQTPGDLLPGALAYALPYEGAHIVVFYDRLKNRPGYSRPGNAQCLLGHVIAHEVGHILQGLARHSEDGIMKATWTGADYLQMTWGPLRFTDEDVTLIHNGLKARLRRGLPQ